MKITRRRLLYTLAVLSLIFLSSCAGVPKALEPMKAQEMYEFPDLNKALPPHMTVVAYPLPRRLNATDTAFFPDWGIGPSDTWPAALLPPGSTDMKQAKRILAIRKSIPEISPEPMLVIFIPERYEDIKDHLLVPFDHNVQRFVSAGGGLHRISNLNKFNPSDCDGLIKSISGLIYSDETKGDDSYMNKLSLLKDFHNQMGENWLGAQDALYEYFTERGIALSHRLTDKQMDLITNDQLFSSKMFSFLGEGWGFFVSYPLLTPETYGISILASKAFQIPKHFWKPNLNKEGSMDRVLTADQWFAAKEYDRETYGLSDDDMEFIRGLKRIISNKEGLTALRKALGK